LDWGIGHATRCIPLIHRLQEAGLEVVIAAGGRPLDVLRREFPDLITVEFPGTRVRYPAGGSMVFAMLRMTPRMLMGIRLEHRKLREIAAAYRAGLIISDNRYGCWHPDIPSVFITHQLEIRVPARLKMLSGLLRAISRHYIKKYRECWIPDFELHRGLAGDLSHPAKLPHHAYFIGILSRFAGRRDPYREAPRPGFDILVMLSGPEPQRTILEEKILHQIVSIDMQVAMVRGMPESDEAYVLDGRIHVFSHLDGEKMEELINRSALVICRSGYSSIMDIVTLGKAAILIPTPGQTEQEYLARYLMEKKIYFSIDQENFDLLYALEMSKNFPGMVMRNDMKFLDSRIRELAGLL